MVVMRITLDSTGVGRAGSARRELRVRTGIGVEASEARGGVGGNVLRYHHV